MSDIFAGVVVRYPLERFRKRLHSIELDALRFVVLGFEGYSVLDDTLVREQPETRASETLAMTVSESFQPGALVYLYDSRSGYRESRLFRGGRQVASFGEADELWVPTDASGEPIHSAQRLSVGQLEPGVEYETIMNAIDLGLHALSQSYELAWEDLHEVLLNPIKYQLRIGGGA